MALSNAAGFPCKYYTHSTDTEGVSVNLQWTVKNFRKLLLGTNTTYNFPPVRPTPQCDLEVSFCKDYAYLDDLCIVVESKLETDMRFDATTNIIDEMGENLLQEDSKFLFLQGKIKIGSVKNRHVLPDSFVIGIELELYNFTSEKCDTAASQGNEIKLLEDMKNFIQSELPVEVVLKTRDDEISANKAILRARSPVFQRMFDHPLKEQEKNIVHVDDVSGTTLLTLVHFLYSGKVDISKSDLQALKELYYAADKYQVLDLHEMCAQNMCSVMLKEENAIELLVLAHQHSDQYLKNKCLRFIRTCIEALMETESWMNFKVSYPGLIIELFETCCKGSAAFKQKT